MATPVAVANKCQAATKKPPAAAAGSGFPTVNGGKGDAQPLDKPLLRENELGTKGAKTSKGTVLVFHICCFAMKNNIVKNMIVVLGDARRALGDLQIGDTTVNHGVN